MAQSVVASVADQLIAEWLARGEHRTLLDGLLKGRRRTVHELNAGASALLVAAVARSLSSPLLVVTPTQAEAERLAADLDWWLHDRSPLLLPALEPVPYRVFSRSTEQEVARLAVLEQLVVRSRPLSAKETSGQLPLIVAPAAALSNLLVSPQLFAQQVLRLEVGQSWAVDELAQRLAAAGYERLPRVEHGGQFSVRGDIVDVCPPAGDPIRAEFFDVQIDSLRRFDLDDQRSREPLAAAWVGPAHEAVVPSALRQAALARLADWTPTDKEELLSTPAPARFLPFVVGDRRSSLVDYLPPASPIIVWDAKRVRQQLDDTWKQWLLRVQGLIEQGNAHPGQEQLLLRPEEIWTAIARRSGLDMSTLDQGSASGERPLAIKAHEPPDFRGQERLIIEEVRRWFRDGYRLLVTAADETEPATLRAALRENGIESTWLPDGSGEMGEGCVTIVPRSLSTGMVFPALRVVVLTMRELRGQPSRRGVRAQRVRTPTAAGSPISRWEELEPGDYVVHVHHGIGQFLGMQTKEVQGVQRDYMVIKYDGDDRLYVPTAQIDLVQRYVGSEGRRPHLHRLGGAEWERLKTRVRASVHDLAGQLVQLYAIRQSAPGIVFASDTPWQREFEESFPHEETPDQLTAIDEIKRDMEKATPMDRLLCGDVGFGKTEVALRAAFKAVMSGRQTAILVPTTVLAHQHYLTFTERLRGFPIQVGELSRFRSNAEKEDVITGLRRGTVDIVIGTHRMLQADVAFHNLGLLIVDEEQRFGVAHKEFLKHLRTNVDVLTLTATPIPRTLQMSLAGLRDMSVIETAPRDRFPVETLVLEYDPAVVREAIERELARHGQVYYVHNRVQSIGRTYDFLQELVPHARIGVAHGQIPDERLEQVMMDFLEGRYDVLLCTSIIENGLDIPRVNTLIVEDSHRFGLAQLYQMRGRVGRSDRVAHAYFTVPHGRVLSEAAEKRLEALKDFTELGAGFKIALRDLEIRGAGNILGAEQHGFIESVGFDLYTQFLEQEVRELRGEHEVTPMKTAVDLLLDAYIPDSYVGEPRQKIELYKRVNRLEQMEQVEDLIDELVDRFGEPPAPVANLVALAEIRIRATALGILTISQEGGRITVQFAAYMTGLLGDMRWLRPQLPEVIAVDGGKARLVLSPAAGEAVAAARRLLKTVEDAPALRRWSGQEAPR